jgi:hypothetical protein
MAADEHIGRHFAGVDFCVVGRDAAPLREREGDGGSRNKKAA